MADSSSEKYNQVRVKIILSGTETTVSIFTSGGLYKISLDGKGIGSGIDKTKAIKYLFK
jgi:invasion protein IalB